jgi:hypothetical protein
MERSALKKKPYNKHNMKVGEAGEVLLTKQGKHLLQKNICPCCVKKKLTRNIVTPKYIYKYECRVCGTHFWSYPKLGVVIVAQYSF